METNNMISYILFRIGAFTIFFYAILGCQTVKAKKTTILRKRTGLYPSAA
ncbi:MULTISPECIES: hypothetical protein [Sphingobacterium]|nr:MULTISPECIES: hypothetical protein [unclassified Sphingobacterium]